MEKQFSYKKIDIYNASNKGLDIINDYYPKSIGLEGKNKHFKVREGDKTPSANLWYSEQQKCWCVKDWGDKLLSPIDVVMLEDSVTFAEAIQQLAVKYNLTENTPEHLKPVVKYLDTNKTAKEKDYNFKFANQVPEHALQYLGVMVNQEHCEYFNLKYVLELHYTYLDKNTNKLKTLVKKSTEKYPIFAFDHKTWQKTYEPLAEKKGDRFRFYGTKPKRFIFGLDQIKQRIIDKRADYDGPEETKDVKLNNAIIVSGGSDGLNVFSLNTSEYNVIWYNSESEQINGKELNSLLKDVKNVYHIPDADPTGETKAIALANTFLHIKNIWLPARLLKGNDWRGKKLKDAKDLITKHYKKDNPDSVINLFSKLYYSALPFRIWDQYTNKKTKVSTYKFNTKQAVVFLSKNGFYKVESEHKDKKSVNDRYYYVRKIKNVVSITNQVEIKDFVNDFLEEKNVAIGIKNLIYDTTKLNEKTLQQLPLLKLDFKNANSSTQYKHFKNGVFKITANNVELLKTDDVKINVWQHNIIDKKVSVLEPFFKIDATNPDVCTIEVLNKDCWFFNYLINTSRTHWVEEYENADATYKKENQFNIAGLNLSLEQRLEQQQHLVNKISALGYFFYRYKKRSKTWQIIAMDEAINQLNGSGNGGSGKTLTWDLAVKEWFPKTVTVSGNDEVLKDKHAFENVTENTEAVLLVDTHKNYSTRDNFEKISGDFDVNPKGKKVYSIPFADSPKIASTTNFVDPEIDSGSKIRRSFPTFYSDYYHSKTDTYKSEHSVRDDFNGNDLFSTSEDEFSNEQWNMFYNFISQCISFYLEYNDRIFPPLENFYKRAQKASMGVTFFQWANDYFGKNIDKLNSEITRRQIFEAYKVDAGKYAQSPQKFKEKLIQWCQYNNYNFNPPEILNPDSTGRKIKKIEGKNEEMLYIEAVLTTEQKQDLNEIETVKNTFNQLIPEEEKEDDIPY